MGFFALLCLLALGPLTTVIAQPSALSPVSGPDPLVAAAPVSSPSQVDVTADAPTAEPPTADGPTADGPAPEASPTGVELDYEFMDEELDDAVAEMEQTPVEDAAAETEQTPVEDAASETEQTPVVDSTAELAAPPAPAPVADMAAPIDVAEPPTIPAVSAAPVTIQPSPSPVIQTPVPPRRIGPTDAAPVAGEINIADQILDQVKQGDTEAAGELISQAVARDNADAVTEASVKARDENLTEQMVDALTSALLKGVAPSDLAESFTVLGGSG